MHINLDQVMELVMADNNVGVCIDCGTEHDCCEPDARHYECFECHTNTVFGASELLFMIGEDAE